MFQLPLVFLCLKSGEKLTQLDLVIPGLCGPLPDIDRLDSKSIHALIACLAKADQQTTKQKSFHEVLDSLFALDQSKPFPAAALSLLASGQYTEHGFWFHVDPVHLQADMDHAILRDTHGLDLTQQESESLLEELNAHFKDDGIRFLMADKDRWFLNISDHEKVSTTPLNEVISRNVYSFMPEGEDALFWKKFMNEVQMLMFQSQVNAQREQNNKLPVNGVWLWGEGALPDRSKLQSMEVYSQHSLLKGLSTLNNLNCHSMPGVKTFIEQVSNQENNLLVLDDLFNVTCYGDVMEWQSSFNDLYASWLEPLLAWAMKNKVKVNLHACNGVCYQIASHNRFRFFRNKKIENHIKTYE